MANGVTPAMWEEKPGRRKIQVQKLEDDADGEQTVSFLTQVKRAASLISGNEPRSLGLHPIVYFYSDSGRFLPVSLLATIKFIQELARDKKLRKFTEVRNEFEEFLLTHKHFVSALGHTYGSRTRALDPLVEMYHAVYKELASGKTRPEVEESLLNGPLSHTLRSVGERPKATKRTKFSSDKKSASFLEQALAAPNRCNICGARLHLKGITIDHRTRKQDGGKGGADNAQPTHPYCNSGYKESQHARAASGKKVQPPE